MFCENCGNNIPDGVSVCPNCGVKVYNESDMDDLLSELTQALDDLKNDAPEQNAQEEAAPVIVPMEPAADMPEEAAEADSSETYEVPSDDFDADTLIGSAFAAAGPAVQETAESNAEAAAQKPVKSQSRPAQKKTGTASGKKKPAAPAKNSKNSKKSRKKKKKKKKNNGSGILGVVIGLIVALLLIALAAGYMLFRMGFFSSINSTDEELLYNSAAEATEENTVAAAADIQVTPAAVDSAAEAEDLPADSSEEEDDETEAADEKKDADVEVTSFELTGDETITIYSRGTTAEPEYEIVPEEAASQIEWTSDDESIATVDENGVIAAKRGGECTITGTCGDYSVTIKVVCSFSVPETVLDMNYEDVTLTYEGETLELEIESDEMTDELRKATVWESTDEEVATVDEDGVITAVGDGTAVISAAINGYTASCIVRCVDVTGNKGVNSTSSPYVINHEDVTLSRKGEYFELTITSIDGSDVPDFDWTSSDKSVAKVDSDGVVTAVSSGTAYITATVDGDDFQCIVRVNIS